MDSEDEARPAFFGGLAAAIVAALFGLFGPHDGSVWRMPQALQHRVEAALEGARLPSLEVEMHGQRAVIAGVVNNEAAVASAHRAALGAAGAGGPWAGGITTVDVSNVGVGETEAPFEWRITKADRAVTLSGAAPSAPARDALLIRARALFQNHEIVDRMRIVGGAPSSAWRGVALDAMTQLARLGRGEVWMSDGAVVVIGEGERDAVAAVRTRYDTPLPAPYRARADVIVTGEPLAIPELADLNLSDANPAVCAQAFQRLMTNNVINFASGSAELERDSLPLLDNLASIALRCDRYDIEVAGHTDNQGPRELNLDLSRRRAEAVVAYLVGLNVSRERLRAIGYGPDQPVASNATPGGQGANRRIVFTVRG